MSNTYIHIYDVKKLFHIIRDKKWTYIYMTKYYMFYIFYNIFIFYHDTYLWCIICIITSATQLCIPLNSIYLQLFYIYIFYFISDYPKLLNWRFSYWNIHSLYYIMICWNTYERIKWCDKTFFMKGEKKYTCIYNVQKYMFYYFYTFFIFMM